MSTYYLTVEFADECYEEEVDVDINQLWENAEIGYPELFEYVGVPYNPFEKWSADEIADMTTYSCVLLNDD